jgi:protein SCO1
VEGQRRRLRLRPAEPVPDLTDGILAAIPSGTAPRRLPRKRAALAASAAAVLAGASLGGWALSRPSSSPMVSAHQVAGPSQTNGRFPGALVLPMRVDKPTVSLTDTSGRRYDVAADTAGKVTLLYFGYTHCPDVCPINMALAAAAIRQLPSAEQARVTTVFVTTDPARDTGPVLRSWLNAFDDRFVGLTGTMAQIHQAETEVQMPLSYVETTMSGPGTASYQVAHAGYTIVYSTSGSSTLQVDTSDTPADLAITLKHLLSEQ